MVSYFLQLQNSLHSTLVPSFLEMREHCFVQREPELEHKLIFASPAIHEYQPNMGIHIYHFQISPVSVYLLILFSTIKLTYLFK